MPPSTGEAVRRVSTRHQILSRLSRLCPVVIVDPPVEARDALSGRAGRRPALQVIGPGLWSTGLRDTCPLCTVRQPRRAPRRGCAASTWSRRSVASDSSSPIHYVWHPDYASTLRRLPRRFTIYHRYDKYDAYDNLSDVAVAQARERERRVAGRADLLSRLRASMAADLEGLVGRQVRAFAARCRLRALPGAREPGVNPGRSGPASPAPASASWADSPRRRTTERLRRSPRSGPPGRSSSSARTAIARPRGGRGSGSRLFLERACTRGASGEEVPAYVAGLDVTLLCYRLDTWAKWVQPIKAYEYLACGKPIVSSPIDAAADFGDLVRVVDSAGGWVPTIEAALAGDTAAKMSRRVSFARWNTWSDRVLELVQILEEALGRSARTVRAVKGQRASCIRAGAQLDGNLEEES